MTILAKAASVFVKGAFFLYNSSVEIAILWYWRDKFTNGTDFEALAAGFVKSRGFERRN
jgi:hypothetical protein